MMKNEVPIDECLGIPVSQHVVLHICSIQSLEKILGSYFVRKRKKEIEDWDLAQMKIARATDFSSLEDFVLQSMNAKMSMGEFCFFINSVFTMGTSRFHFFLHDGKIGIN